MASSSSNGPPERSNEPNESKEPPKMPFRTNCACCRKNAEMLQFHEILRANKVPQNNRAHYFRIFSLGPKMDCEDCENVKTRIALLPSPACYEFDQDQQGFINVVVRRDHAHFLLRETAVFRHIIGDTPTQ